MDEHRDQTIERMLRQGAGAPTAPVTSADCIDGERLAAWAARAVAAREAARIEQHVADCDRCQAMVATFMRTAPVLGTAPPPWWRSGRVGWLVPVAAAALVAAVWVAMPDRAAHVPEATSAAAQQDVQLQAPAPSAEASSSLPSPRISRDRPAAPPLAARNAAGRQTPPASPEERTAKREDAERPAAVRPESAAAGELGKPSDAQETIAITGGSAALLVRGAPATDISARGTTRWRILRNTQLQRSRDGSAWDTVDFAPAAPLTAGHAPVDNVLWLVGRGGTIYVTADGVTFARVSFIDNVDLVAVSAQNRQQAVVTAGDGRAWRTTDGGASWTPR